MFLVFADFFLSNQKKKKMKKIQNSSVLCNDSCPQNVYHSTYGYNGSLLEENRGGRRCRLISLTCG